jgi:tetratricopeptide (TPR) repeat protein
VVGVPAATIRGIAHEFASAESACVHMSTGVNMGRQGTLCYWLLHMLSFVTGNLDRPGGNLYSLGFYPAAKAGKLDLASVFFPSEHGELRHVRGMLPGNLLADMIEGGETPIRALVVIAGNPILSMGGGERLRRAFEKLELVIVLDMFRSATGEYADYLLPCTDMLERRDLNICGLGMQHQPFVQYTDAVVPAASERKEEWWILGKLEQALGLRSVFDAGEAPDVFARLDKMLRASGLSVQQLEAAPQHTVVLPKLSHGRFYSDWIQTADKRVDCCPPLFDEALARAHALFEDLRSSPPEQLKLISLRTNFMQNSWYQNVQKLKGRKHQINPLHMAVEDAARLGFTDGAAVTVSSDWGRIEATVLVDETLRAGVVAMTHGWGNERTPGLRVASRHPGVNVNALLPSGPGSYEKLSNQAHMTGVRQALAAGEQAWGPVRGWRAPEPCLLGSRIAYQLGLFRTSAAMVLAAWRRHRQLPALQHAAIRVLLNSRGPFAALRAWQRTGERLATDDQTLQADWLALRGILYGAYRDWDRAWAMIEQASDLGGDGREFDLERAWLLQQQDRYDESLAAIETAARTPGRLQRASIQRTATIYEILGRADDAIAILQDAVASMESVDVGMQLYGLLIDRERYAEADACLKRVEDLLPETGKWLGESIRAARFQSLYQQGDIAGAVAVLDGTRNRYFRTVRENLLAAPAGELPRLLDVPFIRQHHMTCAPATFAAISRFHGRPVDHLELAAQICYDGTPALQERRWISGNGWAVREFELNLDNVRTLIDAGLPGGICHGGAGFCPHAGDHRL